MGPHGWEVTEDPASTPFSPGFLDSSATPTPFLPTKAFTPHPHFPEAVLEPDTEIRGLFSKRPEFREDCGSESEGPWKWEGGGENG